MIKREHYKDLGYKPFLFYVIFGVTAEELQSRLDPSNYIGRSVQQVEEFLAECVKPVLANAETAADVELTV